MLKKLSRAFITLIGAVVGYGVYKFLFFAVEKTGVDIDKIFDSGQKHFIALIFAIIFSFIFFKMSPLIMKQGEKVADNIEDDLRGVSGNNILSGVLGLIMGLIIALLITKSFEFVANSYIYAIMSVSTYVILGYLGAVIATKKGQEISQNFLGRKNAETETEGYGFIRKKKNEGGIPKIIDTSVIIDGRIAEIMKTGFLEGPVIIPEFVLVELRHIADSSDTLKRTKGRRGLDILNRIQEEYGVEIYDTNNDRAIRSIPEVDVKLLKLAQIMNGKVVTNDYNLNKVAGINEIDVLNINELANTLKPIVIPGEEMRVTLVKQGKDSSQAVGYLDDGTMIVVEDGRKLIGATTDIVVTSVLQTAAGRMIFGRLKKKNA